jgi:hypothetical protein
MRASLTDYPGWLQAVNTELARLSNDIFSAEDFDYPWIEKFMADVDAVNAAHEALADDGFIVENLPAPAMRRRGDQCPEA